MVTEGGMYVLQLMDNHAGTYCALIVGVIEVLVVSYCYGVERFLDDIQTMFRWSTNSKGYRYCTGNATIQGRKCILGSLTNIIWQYTSMAKLSEQIIQR